MQKRLNTIQAAEYLTKEVGIKTSPGSLEVYRCQGRGPRYLKIGKRVYYTKEYCDEYATGTVVETINSLNACDRG